MVQVLTQEFNWWEAGEVMRSYGKRLPRADEFGALAYGTTEASSVGSRSNRYHSQRRLHIQMGCYSSHWRFVFLG
jgi:hypothetical protein